MISVVIPAYNEEKYIATCLASFEHQTTKEPFEVILVDNASTDSTVEIAKKFVDQLPLKIIEERQKGRGYARATGFEAAKGDIILSTDSDGYVPDDWIEKMSLAFEDPEIIAVTCPVKAYDLGRIKTKIMEVGVPFAMNLYKFLYRHYWLTGSNFGIRKSIYEKSGGFTRGEGLEDIDLSIKVAKLGEIAYRPIWGWTSGRRFKKISVGLNDYWHAYIEYFWKNSRAMHFPDRK